jgi:hypothetical protein
VSDNGRPEPTPEEKALAQEEQQELQAATNALLPQFTLALQKATGRPVAAVFVGVHWEASKTFGFHLNEAIGIPAAQAAVKSLGTNLHDVFTRFRMLLNEKLIKDGDKKRGLLG